MSMAVVYGGTVAVPNEVDQSPCSPAVPTLVSVLTIVEPETTVKEPRAVVDTTVTSQHQSSFHRGRRNS